MRTLAAFAIGCVALGVGLGAVACRSTDTRSVPTPAAALGRANVLLVTIDTLRADHVGAYGGRLRRDAHAGPARRRGAPRRDRLRARPGDAAVPHGAHDGRVSLRERRARQRLVSIRWRDAHTGEHAEGRGLSHGRVRVGVRARRAVRVERGLRCLRRQIRIPCGGRRTLTPRAPGAGHARGRHRVDRRARRCGAAALVYLGAPLRPARAVRFAGAIQDAVLRRRVQRGSGVRRQRPGLSSGRAHAQGTACPHAGRGGERPRRVARGARRTHPRIVRLRLDSPGAARAVGAWCRCTGRAEGPRAPRGRDAHGPGPRGHRGSVGERAKPVAVCREPAGRSTTWTCTSRP